MTSAISLWVRPGGGLRRAHPCLAPSFVLPKRVWTLSTLTSGLFGGSESGFPQFGLGLGVTSGSHYSSVTGRDLPERGRPCRITPVGTPFMPRALVVGHPAVETGGRLAQVSHGWRSAHGDLPGQWCLAGWPGKATQKPGLAPSRRPTNSYSENAGQ